MDKVKDLTLADLLFALAILAIIYFTWRSIAPFSAMDFGGGVATIFGGKGAHIWAKSQESDK